ncbi:MAG: hypothetical protein MR308_00475 [Lachnospiraceae bacterium]|nr:hypothetical protein [Lachnospiraceae bacterium]
MQSYRGIIPHHFVLTTGNGRHPPFLYTLAESTISGLLLNFIGVLVIGYLSGCFYPNGHGVSDFEPAFEFVKNA